MKALRALWGAIGAVLPFVIVFGVTVGLFLYPSFKGKSVPEQRKKDKKPPAVFVRPVTRTRLVEEFHGTGVASPQAEVTVAVQLDGILRNMHAAAGDLVQRGSDLAAMDDQLLQAELAVAEATMERSSKELERIQVLVSKTLATESRLQEAFAAVQTSEAAALKVRTMLALTKIASPIDGIITAQFRHPGDSVQAGAALYTVADVSRLRVLVEAPERVSSSIQPGHSVKVRVPAIGNRGFDATVKRVYPVSDPDSHYQTIECDLGAVFPEMKPGFFVIVTLTTDVRTDVVAVESRAIRLDAAGRQSVFVVSQGMVERRDVGTGMTAGELTEVLTGLEEGESVVVRGADRLQPGMAVRTTDRSESKMEEDK